MEFSEIRRMVDDLDRAAVSTVVTAQCGRAAWGELIAHFVNKSAPSYSILGIKVTVNVAMPDNEVWAYDRTGRLVRVVNLGKANVPPAADSNQN